MGLTIVSRSTDLAISVDEAKLHCRVDDTAGDETAWFQRTIRAAALMAEGRTGRALISAQYDLTLDAFPAGPIRLARPPVQSIESLKYWRTDDTLVTVDSADYSLDAGNLPGWVVCDPDKDWPTDVDDRANAVIVRFTVGYASPSLIPEDITSWIACTVAELYDSRTHSIDYKQKPATFTDGLLDRFTVPKL